MSSLPIDAVLFKLLASLEKFNTLILHAPPGAGKTTRVPLCLLSQSTWLNNQRIVVLEPRRLAARAAAYRMAETLSESVGLTVGYRTRLDSKVSELTRVEVVTEGVLTRMLQQDPELKGIGCIIFDEFHERSIHADLGLALSLDVQSSLREDLRLIVMSATLDVNSLTKLLGSVPLISSAGRTYPVDIRYLGGNGKAGVVADTVKAVERALLEEEGSILVFLPGEAEIKRVAAALTKLALNGNVIVTPLYGVLSRDEQDSAILKCHPNYRKVVLASAIAETSLTIDGVRIVVDAGWMRTSRFDVNVGMSRLQTLRVSQASAEQRCGRAGRMEAGVCYRLWTQEQNKGLVKFYAPEILSADLTPVVLELAQWGVSEPGDLRWVDSPPAAAYDQARDLLRNLGALNAQHCLTEHGRQLLQLGIHPRLAHMVLKAKTLGLARLGCEVAALLGERDIFKVRGMSVDLQQRIGALHGEAGYEGVVDKHALQRVLQVIKQLARKLRLREQDRDSYQNCGLLLALAFPDRIGQRRGSDDGRLLLSNGRGARIDSLDPLAQSDFIVVAHLGGQGIDPSVYLAASIAKDVLSTHCSELITKEEICFWDNRLARVQARVETRLGALVLNSQHLDVSDREQAKHILLDVIKKSNLKILSLDSKHEQWLARARLLATLLASGKLKSLLTTKWPCVTEAELIDSLAQWLGPYLDGIYSGEQIKRLDMNVILTGLLTWEQRQWLDAVLPTHFEAPTGSRVAIDYLAEDGPVIAVRLQEMFGLAQTPTVAKGLLQLKLHLLSPARRPIQITRDLAGFWDGSYAQVKKEMKGRYPKHYWPDDPLSAEPTTRAQSRR